MSGLKKYSVLKGTIVGNDTDKSPHYTIFVSDGSKKYKAPVNVGSKSKVVVKK